jgi:DUF1365 family protein
MSFHSALYRGRLVHARNDAHARRAFRYPVFVASLDLDELADLDRELRLFSHGGRNVFAFHDDDYAATLSPSARADDSRIPTTRVEDSRTPAPRASDARSPASRGGGLRDGLDALLDGQGIARPATVRLVTNLRTFGYVFNPVSFFCGYDATGALTCVVAEVNNTYGGRLRYVLGPEQRIGDRRGRVGFRHVRELFVSPFLHGPATYDFWFPGRVDTEELAIGMTVEQAGKGVFVARLEGARVELSDRALAVAALRYPMMSAQVIGLIHWQALKLRLAGVPYRRPHGDHRPLARDPGEPPDEVARSNV